MQDTRRFPSDEREIYRIQFDGITASRSRKFELKRITPRWKLVKTNKDLGDPPRALARSAFGVRNRGLNRDRAIPQTGRFEPSDKRCNNSAPIFHRAPPPLSTPDHRHPRRFPEPSRETLCLQDKQESFARKSQRWWRLKDRFSLPVFLSLFLS